MANPSFSATVRAVNVVFNTYVTHARYSLRLNFVLSKL